MKIIGYARVSTADQTLDLQRDALRAAGASDIYEDKASGKNADRPELLHCLKALREGDTLVVWRLDRLGRNAQDLIRIVNDLAHRGVKLRSLKESIDTEEAHHPENESFIWWQRFCRPSARDRSHLLREIETNKRNKKGLRARKFHLCH